MKKTGSFRIMAIAGVLVAGLLVAACGGSNSSSTTARRVKGMPAQPVEPPGPRTTPKPTAPPVVTPSLYASIGDSYSSGEGTEQYDSGTDDLGTNTCHRGPKAWPRLAGVPTGSHLACSGSLLADLTRDAVDFGHEGNHVSQWDRLVGARPRPGLVFLTIGGNDMGFGDVITHCVAHVGDCFNDTALVAKSAWLTNFLGPRLQDFYDRLQRAMPTTRIVVASYPRLFPKGGIIDCAWLGRSDADRLNLLGRRLADEIRNRANAVGVEYVDLYDALDGHEACSGSGSWMEPVVGHITNHEAMHPTVPGQAAMADLVKAYLSAPPATRLTVNWTPSNDPTLCDNVSRVVATLKGASAGERFGFVPEVGAPAIQAATASSSGQVNVNFACRATTFKSWRYTAKSVSNPTKTVTFTIHGIDPIPFPNQAASAQYELRNKMSGYCINSPGTYTNFILTRCTSPGDYELFGFTLNSGGTWSVYVKQHSDRGLVAIKAEPGTEIAADAKVARAGTRGQWRLRYLGGGLWNLESAALQLLPVPPTMCLGLPWNITTSYLDHVKLYDCDGTESHVWEIVPA